MISFDRFIYEEMQSNRTEMQPLYRTYAIEMLEMIEQLALAARNENPDAFQRILHNIKGINANMRIESLEESAAEISRRLKAGDPVDLHEAGRDISIQFEKVQTQIRSYFGKA